MTDREGTLRLLTIRPEDLRRWTMVCRKVGKDLYGSHPDYPRLDDMQLLSLVKRLLPEIRAMIASGDATAARMR